MRPAKVVPDRISGWLKEMEAAEMFGGTRHSGPALAAIRAVVELHTPGPYYEAERSDGETVTNRLCRYCKHNWPCPTIRAIEDKAPKGTNR